MKKLSQQEKLLRLKEILRRKTVMIHAACNVPAFHNSLYVPASFTPSMDLRFNALGSHRSKCTTTLGSEIATLVHEQMNAGTYEKRFDGGRRASGVFFYRLILGDYSATKRLMPLK